MGKRVKFKSRRTKANMQEAFELCLHQRRKDKAGNPVPGYTFEQIMEMTPSSREHLLQTSWLKQRWLDTRDRREGAYERSREATGSAKKD